MTTPFVEEPRTGTTARLLAFAGGTSLAMLALLVVAATTSNRAPAPLAVSATTMPAVRAERPTTAIRAAAAQVWRTEGSVSKSTMLAVHGAPAFVSAAPVAYPDTASLPLAAKAPLPTDSVLLLTPTHVYRVEWDDLATIIAPDDSVVVTSDGHVVAMFVSGELRLLVDD